MHEAIGNSDRATRRSTRKARRWVDWDAFVLGAAMNPCPCGYCGDPRRDRICAPGVLVATRSGSQLGPQQEDPIALRSLSCAEERKQRGSVLCQERHDALTTPIPAAPVLARRSNARSQRAAPQSWRRTKHTVLK